MNNKKFYQEVCKTMEYKEEIIGIVIEKPVWVLQLKNNNGIIKIDLSDIEDIVIIGEVIND